MTDISSTLFVTKLPRTFTAEHVRALFEQIGGVAYVIRPQDKETGLLRTFGFVVMDNDESAAEAVKQLDGLPIEGQPIVVKFSDKPVSPPRPPRPQNSFKPRFGTSSGDFQWEGRGETARKLVSKPLGIASSTRLTLVGKPGHVEVLPKFVIIGMQHTLKQTGFPKGLPNPPATPNFYMVYINTKQWRRVAEAIQNPDDLLIIEGQAMFDPTIPGFAVFATNVNTKLLQQASSPKLFAQADEDDLQEAAEAD